MQGYFVRHSTHGLGKIRLSQNGLLPVLFYQIRDTMTFRPEVIKSDFVRLKLSVNQKVLMKNRDGEIVKGTVVETVQKNVLLDWKSPYEYEILSENDGSKLILSEGLLQISLETVATSDSLQNRLISREFDDVQKCINRYSLINSVYRMNKQVGGIRALLSSRIDLHPHQAFVAGTIIEDPIKRYILADEVGLGKTIEAGVVIHDLLSNKPDAKILILAPGALCRQWFCEMHISFGAQGFKLLDLHDPENVDISGWKKMICSTSLAVREFNDVLGHFDWDMVVVDEVHHLLDMNRTYDLVSRLSKQSKDLLLLSAVPVRKREVELLKLLSLLEPQKYQEGSYKEIDFVRLYNGQKDLGGRLRLLQSDLEKFKEFGIEKISEDRLLDRAKRLINLELLKDDLDLRSRLKFMNDNRQMLGSSCDHICRYVMENYRVNRRMFRNRREKLSSQGRLETITRKLEVHFYEPNQIESEIHLTCKKFLRSLKDSGCPTNVLRTFSRLLLFSLSDPLNTACICDAIENTESRKKSIQELNEIESASGLDLGSSIDDFERNLNILVGCLKEYIDDTIFKELCEQVRLWHSSGVSKKIDKLVEVLLPKIKAGEKTLLFVGFPGLAEELLEPLVKQFGEAVVRHFTTDLDDDLKEENVTSFRLNPECLLLVCDESGGEGRNFQFADSLVCYDIPWHISILEQRIGRLDRLGRAEKSPYVEVNMIVNQASDDNGLLDVYSKGFRIFDKSISGLEFAISELQDLVIDNVISTAGSLLDIVDQVAEKVRDERIVDEDEALLDEASFRKDAAQKYIRQQDTNLYLTLENNFLNYFNDIAPNKSPRPKDFSVKRINNRGLFRFKIANVVNGALSVSDSSGERELGDRVGTFNRKLAQRPDYSNVEFFTHGNSFYDSVLRDLDERFFNRTFAVAVNADGLNPFTGIALTLKVRSKKDHFEKYYGLVNRLFDTFEGVTHSIFISLVDGHEVKDSILENLFQKVFLGKLTVNKYNNLSQKQIQNILQNLEANWSDYVEEAFKHVNSRETRIIFQKKMAEDIKTIKIKAELDKTLYANKSDQNAQDQVNTLNNLINLADDYEVFVDKVGLMDVNGFHGNM